ncbi:MAG: hypothetical protein K2K57_04170 [Oscillospiraceae bacterium]|nr:hypothetical protein [Oscillospiraceae bacterium]
MSQLLQITRVPIDIEVNVTRAELRQDSSAPAVKIHRDPGLMQIQAEPIKVQIDNTAPRESLGYGHKNIDTFARDEAQKGISVAYQAIATIVNEGDALARGETTPPDIAAQKVSRTMETIMEFLPKESPDISWTGNTLSINYKADPLSMDWDTNMRPKMEFVPGNIEFIVNQLPRVEIEYVGEPIYFPRSAAPGYEEG